MSSGTTRTATPSWSGPPTTTKDITIRYYYKLSTDLNIESAWTFLDEEDNGFDESDENPDENRPYSFDWNTNAIADCDGTLIPGETYDIGFSATDRLCNTLSVVAAHDAGLTSRLHVVDNIAPHAIITELQREVGNDEIIELPQSVRIRALNYLQATIINGHRDGESVRSTTRRR
jgi:hypothetical protein